MKHWTKEKIIQEYKNSSFNEDEYMKVKWGSHEKMMNRFIRANQELNFTNQNKWLDIGCGTGAFQEYVKNLVPQIMVTAVEMSQPLLNYAKKKVANHDVNFVESDFMEFNNGPYDIVTCIGVLQKTNMRLDTFFSHVAELLNLSGRLFVDTKCSDWKEFKKPGFVPEKEIAWFSKKELLESAQKAKLDVVRCRGFLPENNKEVEPDESHTIFMVCKKRG